MDVFDIGALAFSQQWHRMSYRVSQIIRNSVAFFNSLLNSTAKENAKDLHYRPRVSEIHRWLFQWASYAKRISVSEVIIGNNGQRQGSGHLFGMA